MSNFVEVSDLLKNTGIKPIDHTNFNFGFTTAASNATSQIPMSKPINIPLSQQKEYDYKTPYTPQAHNSGGQYQIGNPHLGKDSKPRSESSNKYQPSSYANDHLADKYKYQPETKLSNITPAYNPYKLSNVGVNLNPPSTKVGSASGINLGNIYKPETTSASNLNTPNIPLYNNQYSANPDVNRIIADIKRNSTSTGSSTPNQGYSSPISVPTPNNNNYNVGGYSSNPITPIPIYKDTSPINQFGTKIEPIKKPLDNTPYNVSSPYSSPLTNLASNNSPYSNASNLGNIGNPTKQSNFGNLNNNYNPPPPPISSLYMSKNFISPFNSIHIKTNRPRFTQKYLSALKICAQTNTPFVDYEFPAKEQSIAGPENIQDYRSIKTWVRPDVIWGKQEFELYYKIIEPNDIQQGFLGDCALLSTIAALAENPSRIQRIFINEEKSKCGLYGINLVWKGAPVEVVIDDLIPVYGNNKPYFQQSKEKELWAFLLEKAWAKLHKNYHQLNGMLVKECMHDLTGAPVRNFDPRRINPQQLWDKLLKAQLQNLNRIVCAGTLGEDTGDDSDPLKKYGLISGHAYSLIGAYEITLMKDLRRNEQKVRLVKMRNPWGSFEWNKTFSDKNEQWNRVSKEDKEKVGYLNEDDGTFFMEFETFRQYYDSIDICYYYDNFSYYGIKCRSLCNQAKYFKIQLKEDSFCFYNVSQLSIRLFSEDYQFVNPKDQGHYSETKVAVADANGNFIHKIKGKKRDLFSPNYVDKDEKERQIFKAGTYYAFVQVQWQKNATHSFGFGCYTKNAEVTEITQYEAKCMSPFVDKWINSDLFDNDIEKVYGRV